MLDPTKGRQHLHSGVVAWRLPNSNDRTDWIAGPPMMRRLHALASLLLLAVVSVDDASAMSRPKHIPVPRPRPTNACTAPATPPLAMPLTDALALASMNAMSADMPAVKQAIELVRKGKPSEATKIEKSIRDPVAQKLVEWVILRSEDSGADFDRYAAFIRDNPSWPSVPLLRRRAEGTLWQERRDAATVRRFLGGNPTSAKGRFALARVLLAEGDRSAAEHEIREAWWTEELSDKLEAQVLDAFRGFLTGSDHRTRMDRRLGAKDFPAAMRAAHRLGSDEVSVVKACAAVAAKSDKARALLEAVPGGARHDLGYTLCRIRWLLRSDGVAEATRLMVAAPREGMRIQDTDEWWRERRTLARKLLDLSDAKTAYQIVREAAPPANVNYRAEFHFMAGWITLRFLDDPATALAHFAHIDDGSANPIVLARAGYWRGRAAETAGQMQEARAHYEAAARYSTAYYGQLARAKLGLGEIVLRPPPEPDTAQRAAISGLDVVRAADILYAIGERELVVSFVADLAEWSIDGAALLALAEITARHEEARATLLIGKTALTRGFALDLYAFPNFGVPRYRPIGPDIDPSIAYSVVRTESAFDQRDVSPAKAVGLMQVTPEAGRDTAGRFGVAYDWKRLVCDPIYNTQMGAAELAGLLRDYRGSYVMAFAGYNAGRGRVDQWVKQHGDPRAPKVDPIDWVERIPFAETRNYVQRVMENLQVYRVRFGISTRLTFEADLGHAAAPGELSAEPRSLSNVSTAK
jgi:soluble lytic murein transglycosylase